MAKILLSLLCIRRHQDTMRQYNSHHWMSRHILHVSLLVAGKFWLKVKLWYIQCIWNEKWRERRTSIKFFYELYSLFTLRCDVILHGIRVEILYKVILQQTYILFTNHRQWWTVVYNCAKVSVSCIYSLMFPSLYHQW